MSRGNHFNHKEKAHPGEFPQNSINEETDHTRQNEQTEDIVTHEAFINRVKADKVKLPSVGVFLHPPLMVS